MSITTTAGLAGPAGRRGRRALTVAAAGAVALGGWALAHPLAGVELAVKSNGEAQQIGPAAVAAASLTAALAAWAVLALLERWTARPRRWFTIVALPVLGVSLFGPLGATDAAGAAVLIGLHLAVAVVLILALPAAARGAHGAR